jgi:multicomponent Na+:H+ antiporter subunit G
MTLLTVVLFILLAIGVVFNVVGTIGLLRFPDVYTRLHAETKTTTFGSIFIAIAVAVFCFARAAFDGDPSGVSLGVHALVAMVVLAFTNATGSHAIAMAAHARGQKPVDGVVDRLKEDQDKAREKKT